MEKNFNSRVFCLKLRTRMFVIFIWASILPLIIMGVLSYNKTRLMLIMDPAEVIQSLLYLTEFFSFTKDPLANKSGLLILLF